MTLKISNVDYLRLRRGYAPALFEKIVSTTGTPVRLLDVATGIGTVVMGLRTHLSEAVGIDTNPEVIAEASKLSDSHIHFHAKRLEAFHPEKQFDLVTIGQAFELLPLSSLSSLSATLRPGGTLAVFWKFPDPGSEASKLFSYAVSPREEKGRELKLLGLEEKLAPHRLSFQSYSEYRSEESYKRDHWIAVSLPEAEDDIRGSLSLRSPKYITEVFINYLWLFRKD